MIPDDEVERVRQSADIVAVIGEFVELRRLGADYRGPCPFHQGTHRNFSVSPRKGMYYCFVCHEGGDVFAFLQKRLGLDWPSAIRHVAAKSGIEVREVKQRQEGPDPRSPLWEANAAAAGYFQRVLWEDAAGLVAREYLAQRLIPKELAQRFMLGFAPREIGLMRSHLTTLGIDDGQQLAAGLLVRRTEEEEPRPRFRQRLVFPIQDQGGRFIAFGGRVIGTGEPKYLNTGETPVFSKGAQLYNLHDAKLAMRKDDRAFVVEGYFDVIRLAAAGVDAAVAPLGTALTDEQAQLLTRFTRNVVLIYDSDKAGLRATFRAGDALLKHGASVQVVSLPKGEDPDTFVQQHGGRALLDEADKGLDVFERKIQILERGGWFADIQKRRKAIDHLLPTIRATADPVMRDIYLARAAEASGVDRAVLLDESRGDRGARARVRESPSRQSPTGQETERAASAPPTTADPGNERRPGREFAAEETLLRCMLQRRSLVERVAERVGPAGFEESRYREVYAALLRLGEEASMEELAGALSGPGVRVLERLLAQPDSIQNFDRTMQDSLVQLEERRLQRRNREIDELIPVASGSEKDRLLSEKTVNQQEYARLYEQRRTP